MNKHIVNTVQSLENVVHILAYQISSIINLKVIWQVCYFLKMFIFIIKKIRSNM